MDENNRRTIKAIILCVFVAMLYTQLFLTPKRKIATPKQGPAVTTQTQSPGAGPTGAPAPNQAAITQPAPVVAVGSESRHPSRAELGDATKTVIHTSLARIVVNHLGGRVASYQLKKFKYRLGEEDSLDMVDNPDGASLPLGVYVGATNDDFVNYSLETVNDQPPASGVEYSVEEGQRVTFRFVGKLSNGRTVRKTLSITGGTYVFTVNVALDPIGPPEEPVWIEWSHYYPVTQVNPRLTITHLTYLDGHDKMRHVQLGDIAKLRDFGTSKWTSIGDLYFIAALVPSSTGRNTMLGKEGDVYVQRVAGDNKGGEFKVYVGPKDFDSLGTVGSDLHRSIDLGWFGFLAYPLLRSIHYLAIFLGNYGLAIVALTLIIKALLLPLSQASLESMRKMQEIQPEVRALKERIPDSKQFNQEVLALYQRRGVNPMGGCLPIAVQIPIFIGLYQALLNSLELRHAPFALWIHDLAAPERFELFGIGIQVMVLIMAVTMFIQQKTAPQPPDPAQAKAMMFMPLIFAGMFIIYPLPSGLVLYMLVNNLISITQQMFKDKSKSSAYKATFVASIAIFAICYVLTLIRF